MAVGVIRGHEHSSYSTWCPKAPIEPESHGRWHREQPGHGLDSLWAPGSFPVFFLKKNKQTNNKKAWQASRREGPEGPEEMGVKHHRRGHQCHLMPQKGSIPILHCTGVFSPSYCVILSSVLVLESNDMFSANIRFLACQIKSLPR